MPRSMGQRTGRDKRFSTMTRRAFLLTLAAGLTAIADELARLFRVCSLDTTTQAA